MSLNFGNFFGVKAKPEAASTAKLRALVSVVGDAVELADQMTRAFADHDVNPDYAEALRDGLSRRQQTLAVLLDSGATRGRAQAMDRAAADVREVLALAHESGWDDPREPGAQLDLCRMVAAGTARYERAQ